jgi:hypothetical protein
VRDLLRMAVLVPLAGVSLGLLGVAPAVAAVPLTGVVSPAAASWTPNVFAGTTSSAACTQWFGGSCSDSGVLSTAIVNGEVVVAGAFTQVCQPGPASSGHCQPGTLVTRDDIFAYQLGTGTIDPDFKPQLDEGPVYSVVAGPGNTVYVGGSFKTVNGASHHGIVQLNVTPGEASTDGSVVTTFHGSVSGTTRRLALSGSALYVGGQFVSADSTAVTDLVRMNATTGALDPSFKMTLSDPVSGKTGTLPLKVEAMALSPSGGTLAIGGTFQDVNGLYRPRLALISTGGGLGSTATLDDWAAPILANNCSAEHDYVRGIDFSPDGSYLVIADTGYKSSSAGSTSVCDAVARFPAAPTGTNIAPTWVNYSGGDSFYAVAVTGATVYAGGHNRWVNNECGNNSPCEANAVLTMGISAIDSNTGQALPWWQPLTLRGRGVDTLASFPAGEFPGSDGGLIIGDNVTLNGEGAYHSFNALFPLTDTTGTPTFGPIPSGMFADGRLGGYDESTAGIAAMCVTDPGDSSAAGTAVEFSTCTNAASQDWTVKAGGNVTINGLCLDTAGEATSAGTKVDLSTCGTSATQVWTQGTGNTLVNKASGLCLDDPGSATSNGTVLDIATCSGGSNQVWPLPAAPEPASLIPTGPVFSAALQSNTQPSCLNDPGNSTTAGTSQQMYMCEGDASQRFTVQGNGTIQLHGLCLDTEGEGKASGTPVVLGTCGSSGTQIWTPGPGGTLVNHAAGLCLSAASSANDSAVTIASCSSTSALQKWWLPAA